MKFQSFKSTGSLQDLRSFDVDAFEKPPLDENVIALYSEFQFFDFLKRGKSSAKIRIPESLFWKKQQFWWLFCSLEKGVPVIKKKKNELSNMASILASFFGVESTESLNFKMLSDETYHKANWKVKVTFKDESILMNEFEVKFFLTHHLSSIKCIQEDINPNNQASKLRRTNENMEVNYEFDPKMNGFKYSFVKNVEEYTKLNEVLRLVKTGKEALAPEGMRTSVVFLLKEFYAGHTYVRDYLRIANFPNLKYSSKEMVKKTKILSLDRSKNEEMNDFCKKIIDYLERVLIARVVKMNFKIAFNAKGTPFFMGSDFIHVKPLINGFPKGASGLDVGQYFKTLQMCQINSTCTFKPPPVFSDNTKSFVFSDKLLPKLILNKCGGDFCQFVPTDIYKETTLMQKNELNLSSMKACNRLHSNRVDDKQPFSIVYNLIKKIRGRLDWAIKILKSNDYIPKSHFTKATSASELDESTYMSVIREKLGENALKHSIESNQKASYNKSFDQRRVCQTCFNVYSLLSLHLRRELQRDINKGENYLIF